MTNPVATLYGYELHHNGHYYTVKSPTQDARVVVTRNGTVGVPTVIFDNRDPHHVAEYARALTTACMVANYFQHIIDHLKPRNES